MNRIDAVRTVGSSLLILCLIVLPAGGASKPAVIKIATLAPEGSAWIQAFNDLVEKGYIVKKKKYPGYTYRWAGVWPENY